MRVAPLAQTGRRGLVVVPALLAMLLLVAVQPGGPSPASGAVDSARAESPSRPDVIVIMTDDQRVGTEQGMPYLWDVLRPQMTHYPNAQVPTNVCCPSRAGFLSGHFSHSTGVWDNTWNAPGTGPSGGWRQFFRSGYENRTLPVALRRQGYHTVLLGKYMNQYYSYKADRPGNPPGWADFRTYLTSNGGYRSPPFPIDRVPPGYTTDTLGDTAAQVIETAPKEQPLFLMYTPYAPHAPSNAGPYRGDAARTGALARMRSAGKWSNPSVGEADRSDKPAWLRAVPPLLRDNGPGSPFPDVRKATEDQADTLMGVDANIRKIVQQQRESRDWDNTVVVFLSDNGIAWGDHALFGKTTPYRLTNQIPLLVKYPAGVAPPGRTDRRLIDQIDLTATIAELAAVPFLTQGHSALQVPSRSGLLLESPTQKRSYKYWHTSYCGWRTKRALYVRYGDGVEELYDYRTDPYELVNQARNPEYRELKTRMAVTAASACTPPPPGYQLPQPVVKVKGTQGRTKLLVNVNPDLTAGRQWRFTVESLLKGRWLATGKTLATRGKLRNRIVDRPRGTYRVLVAAEHGYAGAVSRKVRLLG